MFSASTQYYDAIYAWKDYATEVGQLIESVRAHKRSDGRRLLDLACGTGLHLEHLVRDFDCEGLDVSSGMIDVARRRLPAVPFHLGDMAAFDLGRRFDVVACLFGSVGYLRTEKRLAQAFACIERHLEPGGVALLEPWLQPGEYVAGTVHAVLVDQPELKICRMNTSQVDDRCSVMDMHYLVGTPAGVEHFVEHHELRMYTSAEYETACRSVGLSFEFQETGPMGRGLMIATKPA